LAVTYGEKMVIKTLQYGDMVTSDHQIEIYIDLLNNAFFDDLE